MAGKGARARRKQRRDAEKRQRREQNRMRYAHLIGTGKNSKSERVGAKKKSPYRHMHKYEVIVENNNPDGTCGNPACRECYPMLGKQPSIRNFFP